MKRLFYLSNLGKQIEHIEEAVTLHPNIIQGGVDVCNYKNPPLWNADLEQRLQSADAIIVTNMGVGLDSDFLQRLAKWLYNHHQRYWIDVVESNADVQERLCKGISHQEKLMIERYRRTSGALNYAQLINVGLGIYSEGSFPELHVIPWQGIIGREGAVYTSLADFMSAEGDESKPSIGVYFYRDEWVMGELYYQKALFKTIQQYGYNPIIFFGQYGANHKVGIPNMKGSMNILFGEDVVPFDVLINTCKFSFQSLGAQTLSDLIAQDIPIIQGYTIYMDEQKWDQSLQGLSPVDVNLSVSQPELDGTLQGGLIACHTSNEEGHYIYRPVKERIDAVVRRAVKWSKLRHIPVEERKVAIILHNYPPTNSNIGSAAGLDTPESVLRLLIQMKQDGYSIDDIYSDSAQLMEEILSHATNDRMMLTDTMLDHAEGRLALADYESYFGILPDSVKAQLQEHWGHAPGDVLYYDDAFLIPGFAKGNLWITVQPPRGFGENIAAIYHDPCLPPHHQYQAFYYWIRNIFKADAVIHVGTHGSLEWLPGKGAGLSNSCYPEINVDDMPNIYPYWTTIVGEGIQAKRRSSACLIGHLTPPMTEAGTYDEFEELDYLLDEYAHFESEYPESLSQTMDSIRLLTKKCHLFESDVVDAMNDEALLMGIHSRLSDMKHMQMRNGLHVLGQPPAGDDIIEFVVALLKDTQGDTPSILEVFANSLGFTWADLVSHKGEMHTNGKRNSRIIDVIYHAVYAFVTGAVYGLDDEISHYGLDDTMIQELWPQGMPVSVQHQLEQMTRLIHTEYIPKLENTTHEIWSTMHSLDGGFIEPGPGGAPTSGRADILPTGRNFYGVDERSLPSKAAYELGVVLANQVISDYISQHQRYPESIGIILWASSNTRSHGQCLGEFLYLLGCRPIWQAGGCVTGLEVIPLDELQRPRIDVTARISGLIRDMMPNALAWLDKAVEMVSTLDESPDDNYIKKHVDEDIQWLLDEGDDRDMAFQKARLRVFGDPPQAYGTGVGSLVEYKNWDTLEDIGNVYMTWSQYHQSNDVPQDDRLFKRRLSTMDVTIKNEDNRETHILSADDYYSYHGGLIAAVRTIRGNAPVSYVGDSSQRKFPMVCSVTEELRRVVQGETQNPKFIRAMMRHGYKGASDLSNIVSNTFGWDATADIVGDWIYTGYAQKYALNQEVQQWMAEVNPWALSRLTETLLEAAQRGYWQAPQDILDDLRELYIEMEGQIEGR